MHDISHIDHNQNENEQQNYSSNPYLLSIEETIERSSGWLARFFYKTRWLWLALFWICYLDLLITWWTFKIFFWYPLKLIFVHHL